MEDTYWLEKRIESLEYHIEELYKVIDDWKKIVKDRDVMLELQDKTINEFLKNEY